MGGVQCFRGEISYVSLSVQKLMDFFFGLFLSSFSGIFISIFWCISMKKVLFRDINIVVIGIIRDHCCW